MLWIRGTFAVSEDVATSPISTIEPQQCDEDTGRTKEQSNSASYKSKDTETSSKEQGVKGKISEAEEETDTNPTEAQKKGTPKSTNSRMDVESNQSGKPDGTATRQGLDVSSEGKGSETSANTQMNGYYLLQELIKAYESGDDASIASAEQRIRNFLFSQSDKPKEVYSTYFLRKDNERKSKDNEITRRTNRFIADVCKDVLLKTGLPEKALMSERTRAEFAGSATDPHVLDVMSADPSFYVLDAIVKNPNTADATLKYFKEHDNNGRDFDAQRVLDERRIKRGGSVDGKGEQGEVTEKNNGNVDNQGNPLNEDGTLKVEKSKEQPKQDKKNKSAKGANITDSEQSKGKDDSAKDSAFVSGEDTKLQWSKERALNGEPFLIGKNGSINLVAIPDEVLARMGLEKVPFRLTPSMVGHVYERHKKELKLHSMADAVEAILDVMNNFDHVRKGERDNTFVFSIEGNRTESARRAITFVLEYDRGKWIGIKTVGYDRVSDIKELTTLWEKGEKTSATGVATANVTSEQPLQGDRVDGIASNQSAVIPTHKDTPSAPNKQKNEKKGGKDIGNVSVVNRILGNAKRVVDNAVKKVTINDFTGNDFRLAYCGVRRANGIVEATSGKILIRCKDKYSKKLEGTFQVIHDNLFHKAGDIVPADKVGYPNFQTVIIDPSNTVLKIEKVDIPLDKMIAIARASLDVSKVIKDIDDVQDNFCILNINGTEALFNANNLLTAAAMAKQKGFTEVLYASNGIMQFYKEGDFDGQAILIAPAVQYNRGASLSGFREYGYEAGNGRYPIKIPTSETALKHAVRILTILASANHGLKQTLTNKDGKVKTFSEILGWDEVEKKLVGKNKADLARLIGNTPCIDEAQLNVKQNSNEKPLREHRAEGTQPIDNVEKKLRNALVGLLRKMGLKVSTDSQWAQSVIDRENERVRAHRVSDNSEVSKDGNKIKFLRTKDGEVYGFTVGGEIYIDPRIATSETAIHEYAHLWADMMRAANKEEWQNIVELMKGTPIWDEVKMTYPELKTDDEIADEVLAHYSGRRGAERLREAEREIARSKGTTLESVRALFAIKKVKDALQRFWKGVADMLGIHFTTAEDVADKVLSDLLNGVNPNDFANPNDKARMQFVGEKGAESLAYANERFNEELETFKNKKHKGLLHLGNPSKILKACGVDVKELTISPKTLNRKLKQHNLSVDDLKALVIALQRPILVYKHGDNYPNIVIVTEFVAKGGKLSASIALDENGNVLEIDNVSSIHNKDGSKELKRLSEMREGYLEKALRWVNKKKVSDWLGIADLNSPIHANNPKLLYVAKIINNFENPIVEGDNLYRGDEAKDRIEDLFNMAVSGDLKGKPVAIGTLTKEGKEYLEKISGISFKEKVDFVLNPSDLVHNI